MNSPRSFTNAAASSLKNPPTTPGPSTYNPTVNMESILATLNPAQRRAVTHDPSIPLQILAGPGSGKTKVLTSRIAQLIMEHKLEPSSICAVTFTNKAANEMRDRLTKLIGYKATSALQIGTFHSICARFLRRYANSVGLDPNFTICDMNDSKHILSGLLDEHKEEMTAHNTYYTTSVISSIISREKAKGNSAAVIRAEADELAMTASMRETPQAGTDTVVFYKQLLAEIFSRYEHRLKENNSLDFDDLLVYGVKLFRDYESTTLWCDHILVDEFQDTNTIQYELMAAIATRKCLTIVGDPDQSIYGWRSAEVANLSRMTKDFSPVEKILLETNYRSTSAILRSSLAIVAEDKKRIPKALNTSHPLGPAPFIGTFKSEKEEATFIASEIKRCVANMGGVLRWGDFAILLRFNALSRPLEVALQREGIPWMIMGGHKFFERVEVKDILAYLQLVDNPSYNPAFVRTIKVPTRGIGEKTMAGFAALSETLGIPRLTVVERIHDGEIPDIKPASKRKIAPFVSVIRALRKLDEENTPPSAMIRELVTLIDYEGHLRKAHEDWESRWENVQELITFASESEAALPVQPVPADGDAAEASKKPDSKLRQFLQASMLSSEGDNKSEDESKEKVVITTCHAAKGLEWPVVMVPSVDDHTFPFHRTEDKDEERRLLYVACTRAQSLLYISYSGSRMVAGITQDKELSRFVKWPHRKNRALFSSEVPRFSPEDRTVVAQVLGRDLPDEAEVQRRLEEFENTGDRVQLMSQNAPGGSYTVRATASGNSTYSAARHPSPEKLEANAENRKRRRSSMSREEHAALEARLEAYLAELHTPEVEAIYNRESTRSPSPTRGGSGIARSSGRALAQEGRFSPTFKPASSAFARGPRPVTAAPPAAANKTLGGPSSRQSWSEKPRPRGDGDSSSRSSSPNWRSSRTPPHGFSNPRHPPHAANDMASPQRPGPSNHAASWHADRGERHSPDWRGARPYDARHENSTNRRDRPDWRGARPHGSSAGRARENSPNRGDTPSWRGAKPNDSPVGQENSQSSFVERRPAERPTDPPAPRRDFLDDISALNQMRKLTTGAAGLARAPPRTFSPHLTADAGGSAEPLFPNRVALQDSATLNQLASLTALIPSRPLASHPKEDAQPPRAEPDGGRTGPPEPQPPPTNGLKRRLGMNARTTGYSNKKFKPPT